MILAKFLDTFLILSNIYIAAGLFSLIVKPVLKVTLSPDQAKYIVLVLFSDVPCTTASVVIAAADPCRIHIRSYSGYDPFVPEKRAEFLN